jgi:hypothetical protein
MDYRVRLAALTIFVAAAAFGQQQAVGSWSVRVGGSPFMGPAVTGAPYSAEQTSETVQTLADGTHITETLQTAKMYRDSEGRTRIERSFRMHGMIGASDGADAPVMITIEDPVAHVMYNMSSADKVAHKQAITAMEMPPPSSGGPGRLSAAPAPAGARRATDEGVRPKTTVEKLGKQTMEGILVEGMRHTTTWPVGSMGNDRPITQVNETWMSPELKVAVLTKNSDPRSGEHTQKLTNITRVEPDPSLFQPPADYTISEETNGLQH